TRCIRERDLERDGVGRVLRGAVELIALLGVDPHTVRMNVVYEAGLEGGAPDGKEAGVRGMESLIRRRARHQERQRDESKGSRSARVTPELFLHVVLRWAGGGVEETPLGGSAGFRTYQMLPPEGSARNSGLRLIRPGNIWAAYWVSRPTTPCRLRWSAPCSR